MWKQTVGDWQERRHRRSAPAPATPQANLPESVASTEHSARGFLPRGFHDRAPPSTYPASDGAQAHPSAQPQPHQFIARALTDTWVTVTGASSDDVLDVRDFLDTNVGPTVSHYLPPLAHVRSDAVYIQFASPLQAAQAVRTATYTAQLESGVAAVGVKTTIDAQAAPARSPCYYLEIVVSWCTDQIFLAEREKRRRQLLESAAPSPQRLTSVHMSEARGSADRESSLSLESSARGSELLASAAGTVAAAPGSGSGNGDGGDTAAHPLLPRRRAGQAGEARLSPSPWPSSPSPAGSSASPASSTPTPTPVSANATAASYPPVRDPAAYYRAGGAYRYEDSFFSDGLHSISRDNRQRSTVLGLFFHPCSSSFGILFSLCLYNPLRVVLLVLWTLSNAVVQLLSASSASAKRAPLSRWKQRRTLRASGVVPTSASPAEYVAFFFYKYVPFTPDPEEVDVVLWSWLALRSPYPQRSLHLLKQSLLVRQRNAGVAAGQLRSGRDADGIGNTDVHYYAQFGSVDVLGGEPYNSWERQQRVERRCELPILLQWRPAWGFLRYSSISLLVLTVLLGCNVWNLWL